jgi:hypothetical protein
MHQVGQPSLTQHHQGVPLSPAHLLQVQGLVLAVMVEKARGTKSSWGPYLAFLPADMTHMPLHWEVS